jgi:site-specific DNA-methyltransferase (adenine-specific)
MLGTYQNIDCMELMATLPDKSIDLAIVDPPYGKMPSRGGYGLTKRNYTQNDNKWDILPEKKYYMELMRVSKNQIIWGANHLLENLYSSNCFIVWDKKNESSVMADCELAWTSFKSVTKIFRFTWNGMLQENMIQKETRIHPTQKPVKLYEWLLSNYAKPNDLILDTHCGSASSLIACENLGFKYIASELDKDYYSQSLQRLEAHLAQGKLFQRVGRDEIRLNQPSMSA